MFKKLVSNLPFSPGVTGQLAFYARRLRKEDLTRKLSMVFGVAVLAFQLVAVVSPATSIDASGPNDVINGGFSTKAELISLLNQPQYADAKALYARLGITEARINDAGAPTYIPAKGNNKISFGRHRNAASDTALVVDSAGDTFFGRTLNSVATTANAHVIEGTSTSGAYFALLLSCGNPLVNSIPPPPAAPQPDVKITKKTTIPGMPEAGTNVRPGDLIGYRIFFENAGDGDATGVYVEDSIPTDTTFVSQGSGNADIYNIIDAQYPNHGIELHVFWVYHNFTAGSSGYYVDFTVKVNDNATNGEQICNTAYIRANDDSQTSSNQICHTVIVDAPPPAATPPSTPPPPVTPPPTPTPPTTVTPPPSTATSPTSTPPTPPVDTTPVSASIQLSKSAVYIKHNGQTVTGLLDANGTTAAAGDIIEYTLKVVNSGNGAQVGQTISDDIHDILEYANLTSVGGGTLTPATGVLSWGTVDIPAHSSVNKVFQVTVKDPIPATPRSSSDSTSYDLVMQNIFSNQIKINVTPPTPAKAVESATQQLPETGGSTDIIILSLVAAFLVYFYSRNRQVMKEVAILTVDHNPGV